MARLPKFMQGRLVRRDAETKIPKPPVIARVHGKYVHITTTKNFLTATEAREVGLKLLEVAEEVDPEVAAS